MSAFKHGVNILSSCYLVITGTSLSLYEEELALSSQTGTEYIRAEGRKQRLGEYMYRFTTETLWNFLLDAVGDSPRSPRSDVRTALRQLTGLLLFFICSFGHFLI